MDSFKIIAKIDKLIYFREESKVNKQYFTTGLLRTDIEQLGIVVNDTLDGNYFVKSKKGEFSPGHNINHF
jgi:cysteinyl-tRNA synthetase